MRPVVPEPTIFRTETPAEVLVAMAELAGHHLALLHVALGIPLGLIVGRLVFGAFADTAGTASDASFPYLMPMTMVVGRVLVATGVRQCPPVEPGANHQRSCSSPSDPWAGRAAP